MHASFFQVLEFGPGSLLVRAAGQVGPQLSWTLHALCDRVRALPGVVGAWAGLTEVCVQLHPSSKPALAKAAIEALLPRPSEPQAPRPSERIHELTVRYDGPDLVPLAQQLGLSPNEVTTLHRAATYEVLAVGFQLGFAYLGGLPEALKAPRKLRPRTRVPAGSLAVAEGYTAVYPHASPGGWHLIGTTTALLYDPSAPYPSLLRTGDRVRFNIANA